MGGSLAFISMTALSIPRPDERAEDVFDGVDLHAAVADGRGAFDGFDVVDAGVDDRFVGQVDALELQAAVRRGGAQGEGDVLARVEGNAGEAGGAGEGLLEDGGGHGDDETPQRTRAGRQIVKVTGKKEEGKRGWRVVGAWNVG